MPAGVDPDDPGWWASLLRVMVQVQPIGACMEITFSLALASPPPYRIINQTAHLFTCWQKGLERSATHRVEPHTTAPYAWAESSMEHILVGSLSSVLVAPPDQCSCVLGGTDGRHGEVLMWVRVCWSCVVMALVRGGGRVSGE